ncbi:MAG TPA: M20/M25/M40 family metallo-hydrolase [Gemmatimonadota bacterium]|nr:M20/M25/M40 family metallo-hydrolase [Gemmatimonadota bacterium]
MRSQRSKSEARWGRVALLAVAALAWPAMGRAQESDLSPEDSLLAAHILEELIEIPSVSGTPETVQAARAMADRLEAAGFPEEDVQVLEPLPDVGLLVARYRGSGERPPILLLAHIDVVPALPEDWSVPPFELTLENGWWYARGTNDNKAGAAMLVANYIRYRREGFAPDRDLIVVLTGDEETNSEAIKWIVSEEGRALIDDPAFALNTDSGGGALREGREIMFGVQASEKVYLSFELEVTNPGGHSSQPRPDNAINTLAEGLVRLAGHAWPARLNDVTRAFFERSAAIEGGQLGDDMRAIAADPADGAAAARLSKSPHLNALLRTTCVATMLEAGHAENALPQSARATVNCRILPGESPDEVEATLVSVLADPKIQVRRIREPTASPPSPLTDEVLGTIEELTEEMWPGVPVVPTMSTGATDGLYVRNAGIPVYGVAAIFEDTEDNRAHGRDERVAVDRFYEALDFWYRMVKELASGD